MSTERPSVNGVTFRDLFDDDLDEEMTCPICREIIVNAQILRCQHVFCELCLDEARENGTHTCPLCRQSFTEVEPARSANRRADLLRGQCRRCSQVMSHQEYNSHVPACEQERPRRTAVVPLRYQDGVDSELEMSTDVVEVDVREAADSTDTQLGPVTQDVREDTESTDTQLGPVTQDSTVDSPGTATSRGVGSRGRARSRVARNPVGHRGTNRSRSSNARSRGRTSSSTVRVTGARTLATGDRSRETNPSGSTAPAANSAGNASTAGASATNSTVSVAANQSQSASNTSGTTSSNTNSNTNGSNHTNEAGPSSLDRSTGTTTRGGRAGNANRGGRRDGNRLGFKYRKREQKARNIVRSIRRVREYQRTNLCDLKVAIAAMGLSKSTYHSQFKLYRLFVLSRVSFNNVVRANIRGNHGIAELYGAANREYFELVDGEEYSIIDFESFEDLERDTGHDD